MLKIFNPNYSSQVNIIMNTAYTTDEKAVIAHCISERSPLPVELQAKVDRVNRQIADLVAAERGVKS